jgi:hypothetical protein
MEAALAGYDDALSALDFSALPEALDTTQLPDTTRAFIAYMLEVPPGELPGSLDRDPLIAKDPMGPAILGAYVKGLVTGSGLPDFNFLRLGLHRFYQCARAFPLTLKGFRSAIYEITALPSYPVQSTAKPGIVRLVRIDVNIPLYVAESVVDGELRETEIVIGNNREDNALDFLVYDHEGRLTDRSEFPSANGAQAVLPSPSTCMSCHVNINTLEFSVFEPHPGESGFGQL